MANSVQQATASNMNAICNNETSDFSCQIDDWIWRRARRQRTNVLQLSGVGIKFQIFINAVEWESDESFQMSIRMSTSNREVSRSLQWFLITPAWISISVDLT